MANLESAVSSYSRNGNHVKRYQFIRPLVHGKRVLEIGCANGVGACFLNAEYQSYMGIDVDSELIEWGKVHVSPRIERTNFCTVSDFERAFNGSQFDIVIAFEVIEHVRNPKDLLREMVKRLLPAGTIALSTPNGLLSHHDRHLFRIPEHFDEYTPSQLSEMLQKAGLESIFYKERRIDGLDVIYLNLKSFLSSSKNHDENRKVVSAGEDEHPVETRADRKSMDLSQHISTANAPHRPHPNMRWSDSRVNRLGGIWVKLGLDRAGFWKIQQVPRVTDLGMRASGLLVIARHVQGAELSSQRG